MAGTAAVAMPRAAERGASRVVARHAVFPQEETMAFLVWIVPGLTSEFAGSQLAKSRQKGSILISVVAVLLIYTRCDTFSRL